MWLRIDKPLHSRKCQDVAGAFTPPHGSPALECGEEEESPKGGSPKPRALARGAGFTLAEVLLAAAFSGGLLLVTAFLLRGGFQAASTWEQSIVPIQQMEHGLMQLERDLESMRPFFGVPFQGVPGEITLAQLELTVGPDGEAVPTWMRIVYRCEEHGLVREAFRWQDGERALSIGRQIVIPIEQSGFSFGMLDAQQQLVWESSWDGQTLWNPRLIKLNGTVSLPGEHASITLSRVFRNPAGNLPLLENP